ncbi:MAG: PD40 domain-containing protein [Gemmatimonadetes bacterium]|nr:PD40 domain-containing protein [Gemmatimonadota bacterium]
MRVFGWLVLAAALPLGAARAQDTVPPADRGVRIGITYTPGLRPGMLVLGGAHDALLDSIRTIVERDLDYSDRFELITLPGGDSLTIGIATDPSRSGARTPAAPPAASGPYVNYPLYAALGADYAVNVFRGDSGGVGITLYDVKGELVRRQVAISGAAPDPELRIQVHRATDEMVRIASGVAGIAATRLVFLQRDRIYRVDADGAAVTAVSPAGVRVFSPAWEAGGRRIVYTEFGSGQDRLYILNLATGERRLISPTATSQNWTPAFSPDATALAFARTTDDGTDIYTYNLASDCCLQRLTIGRFSDNLSPTFSPDGRRIAFVSNRPGLPQIYVMAADGTGQELFAPFDYGVTGSSNAPEWSPDGLSIAFHREVAGSPQVFVMDVASRRVRQLTSAGRNEDPTWAPDGRHLTFVSDRTGSRQLWVIDLDTGRVRQVTRVGEARLPAWSPRIGQP